jgi:hypothetical protein
MRKLIYALVSITIAMWMVCARDLVYAQNLSTVIRVLDASGVEGIAGIVLLVNPGDARKSQAFVTNAQGQSITHDLHCEICTISAFDPRGFFATRTTEFSSSSSSFSLVMQVNPLIDTAGDPKAVSIELVIKDSKGEPLAQHNVVIRPTVMTLENNRLSVQVTGSTGRVNVQLRTGDYTVGALNADTVLDARFEITTAKERCSSGTATCIVASPQSSRRMKPISLQLCSGNLSTLVHEAGHMIDPPKPQ